MYRSKFESEVAEVFKDGCYECEKLDYVVPEKKCKYIPDFKDEENGIYYEVKGRFRTLDEARKYLYIRACTHIDLRFIIKDEKTLMPRSKKTMKRWLEDNGFKVYTLEEFQKMKEK